MCTRCGKPPLAGYQVCAKCRAENRAYGLSDHIPFDHAAYARMRKLAHQATSRCVITQRSALALWKIGEQLTIDRIHPEDGYVDGNMQLMAGSLNDAKGVGLEVPQNAIRRLLNKLDRVVEDGLSSGKGAARKS